MWLGQQKGNLQEPLGIACPKTHVKAIEFSIPMTKNHAKKQTWMIKLIKQLIKQLHW